MESPTGMKKLLWAQMLAKEVEAAKGQRKGKGKGERTGDASEHQRPRLLLEMTSDEQWWVRALWKGDLKREMEAYACGPVQANDFFVQHDD